MTHLVVNLPMQKYLALVLILTMTLLPLLSSASPILNMTPKDPASQTQLIQAVTEMPEHQGMQVTSQIKHDCCDPAYCQCSDDCQCQLQTGTLTPQLSSFASISPAIQYHRTEPVSIASFVPDNLFRPPIFIR